MCSYSESEIEVIVLILSISCPVLGVVMIVCKQKLKSNETRVFAQSVQGKWTFFLDVELGETYLS